MVKKIVITGGLGDIGAEIGYGSPAKATTAPNFYNISKEIDFIIDDNRLKNNKYVPGTKF